MLNRIHTFSTLTTNSALNDIRVADLLTWRACNASVTSDDVIVTYRTSDIPDMTTELPQFVHYKQISDNKEVVKGPPILKNTLLDSSTIVEGNKIVTAVSSIDHGVNCTLTLYQDDLPTNTYKLGQAKSPYMMLPNGVNLSKGSTSYVAYSYASADVVTAPYPFRQQLGILEVKDGSMKQCVEITMSDWNKFSVITPHCSMLLKQVVDVPNKYMLIIGASKWDPENSNKDPQVLVYMYDSSLSTLTLVDTILMESTPTSFSIVGSTLIVGCSAATNNLHFYDTTGDENNKMVKKRSMNVNGNIVSLISISDSTLAVVTSPYIRHYEKGEPIPHTRPHCTLFLLSIQDKLLILDTCSVSASSEALALCRSPTTLLVAGTTTHTQGDISVFTVV